MYAAQIPMEYFSSFNEMYFFEEKEILQHYPICYRQNEEKVLLT